MKHIVKLYLDAVKGCPEAVSKPAMAVEHLGVTEAMLAPYGLTPAKLKKLQGMGYALRGWTPPITRKHKAPLNRRCGSQVRWILFDPNEVLDADES
jgi:hypothetical protein